MSLKLEWRKVICSYIFHTSIQETFAVILLCDNPGSELGLEDAMVSKTYTLERTCLALLGIVYLSRVSGLSKRLGE
jgi:hypothetical protein